jgi:hypothetical protein
LLGSLGCLLFYPLFLSILSGQDTIFIYLGLLLWQIGLSRNREILAGFGLAWATLTPTIAGPLGLATIVSHRRSGIWFIVGCLVLGTFSLLLVGIQGVKDFINLLGISSTSTEYGLNPGSMYNLLGFLIRSFPSLELTTARKIAWIVEFISIGAIVILWFRFHKNITLEQINLTTLLITFVSPHLHIHSLTLLLIPLLNVVIRLFQTNGPRRMISLFVVPLSSVFLLLSALFDLRFSYLIVYILLISTTIFLTVTWQRNSSLRLVNSVG